MDACTTPAARRFSPWILGLAVLTGAAVGGTSEILERPGLGPDARLAVALVPVALMAGLFALVVAQVRRLDELQRRIQLDALAVAFPVAALIGMTVEYLQKAGYGLDWTVGDVWPWMLLVYVPAYFVARRRYR